MIHLKLIFWITVIWVVAGCREVQRGTRIPAPPAHSPLGPSSYPPPSRAEANAWIPDQSDWIQVQSERSSLRALQDLQQLSERLQASRIEENRVLLFGGSLMAGPESVYRPEQLAQLWIEQFGASLSDPYLVLLKKSQKVSKDRQRYVFSYEQWMAGRRVDSSLVRLVVEKKSNIWRVVMASAKLAPFSNGSLVNQEPRIQSSQVISQILVRPDYSSFTGWGVPELVIFYDFHQMPRQPPLLAWRIEGSPMDFSGGASFQRKSFFIDAESGELLKERDESVHLNASGQVTGRAISGLAPFSEDVELEEFPLQRLIVEHSAAITALTNATGNYSFTNGSAAPNTIEAFLGFGFDTGAESTLVFDVEDNDYISQSTVINASSSSVDFEFNAAGSEDETAQVNVFENLRLAYRFYQDRATLSELDSQTVIGRVNSSALPCNAAYTPDGDDDNPAFVSFNVETVNCVNSAYSTVIAHEYGHHVVNRMGLTQQAFGEGYSDSLAMLLFDSSGIGFDFQKNGDHLRDPSEQDFRYPCQSSDIYVCGGILAAFFWRLREEIGLSAVQQLFVDWTAITQGGATPTGYSVQNALHAQTIVELLTADDDDSNLANGTPDQDSICEIAEEFGLDCPVMLNFVFDADLPTVITPNEEVGANVTVSAGLGSPLDDSARIFYRINGGEWVDELLSSTGVNTYNFEFPVLAEGDLLEFYFSATTTTGATAYFGRDQYFVIRGLFPAMTTSAIQLPRRLDRLIDPQDNTQLSTGRIFGLGDGLLSITASQMADRELTVTRLPEGLHVGSASLFFYGSEATSGSFVFTNSSRTRVYYASGVGTDISIDPKFCGDFTSISAIHLVETAAGAVSRLIVADGGAGRLHSFAINTADPSLCISEFSISLQGVQWIYSDSGADPQDIWVGYQQAHELWVQRLRSSNLGLLNAGVLLSSTPGSSFGEFPKRNVLSTTGRLVIPIRRANDPQRGSDFLAIFDSSFTLTTHSTCRSPDRVHHDFSTSSVYVYCAVGRVIDVINPISRVALARYPIGTRPNGFWMYTNNSGATFLLVPQTLPRLVLIQSTRSNPSVFSSATINLPSVVESVAGWNESGDVLLLSRSLQRLFNLDLATRVVHSQFYAMPETVEDVAAESISAVHFVSSKVSRAFSLESIDSSNWSLRQYVVGSGASQIRHRTDRLYVLNRLSNSISLVNTTVSPLSAVTTVSTQTRPVHFDISTDVNQLWVANQLSNSITTINITTGVGEGSVVAHTALGFAPSAVEYVHHATAGLRTIYVSGGTRVRALNQSDRATLITRTFSKNVRGLVGGSTSVWVMTPDSFQVHEMDRSALASSTLDGSPKYGVYDFTANEVLFAAPNQKRLMRPGSTSSSVEAFERLYATDTHFAWYEIDLRRLRLSPFSQNGNSALSTFALQLGIAPDVGSAIGGNLWLANSRQSAFQLIDSNLEPERLLNRTRNRPVDLVASTDRIYVAMKQADAIIEYDPATGNTFSYATCLRPEQIEYEAVSDAVFTRCTRGNALHRLIAEDGVIGSSITRYAGDFPVSLSLNATDELLYLVARDSKEVRVFSTSMALVNSQSLSDAPAAVFADPSGAWISSIESRQIQVLNPSHVLQAPIETGSLGIQQLIRNVGSGDLFGLSRSPIFVFRNNEAWRLDNGQSDLVWGKSPAKLESVDDFIAVSYPSAAAVRLFDTSDNGYRDLSVGAGAREMHGIDATDRLYVANYEADTISIIDLSSQSILETVSLPAGCGPTAMTNLVSNSIRYLYILCDRTDRMQVLNIQADANTLESPILLRFRD